MPADKQSAVSLPLPLLTARLRLREMVASDAAGYHALASDPEVMQFLGGATTNRDCEYYRTSLQKERTGLDTLIAVTPRENDAFIGRCGFTWNFFAEEWEVNVVLMRAAWGNGYATEVLSALVDLAFNTLDLKTLAGVVHPENAASITILGKCGFVLDPTITIKQWDTITRVYSKTV